MQRCQAVKLGTTDGCEEIADLLITFPDKTQAHVCQGCGVRLQAIGADLHAPTYLDRLPQAAE